MRKFVMLDGVLTVLLSLGAADALAGEENSHRLRFVDCRSDGYALANAASSGGGTFLIKGVCHGPIVFTYDTKVIGLRHASIENHTNGFAQLAPPGPVVTVSGGTKLTLIRVAVRGGETAGGIVNNGTLKLFFSIVENNDRASGFGGAGVTNNGGKAYVTGSKIRNNRILGGADGGGLWSNGGSVYVSRSHITGNYADDQGGGFMIRGGAMLKLMFSTVYGNEARADGGGAYVRDGSNTHITGSWFKRNEASNGAGIFLRGAMLHARWVTFYRNTAGGSGGALQQDLSSTSTINRGTFKGNTATNGDGGGAHLNGGTLILTKVKATGNTAGDQGGFLRTRPGTTATMNSSTATGNTAPNGADVFNQGTFNNNGSTIGVCFGCV